MLINSLDFNYFFKDNSAQISYEFLLLTALGIILILSLSNTLFVENELNLAISSARTGISESLYADGSAIYPTESYDNYTIDNPYLLYPKDIKLIKIEQGPPEFNSKYNKTKIQLKIYVHSSEVKIPDQGIVGSRINYYARKAIAETFNTSEIADPVSYRAFANKYYFTTADVRWV